MTTLFLFGLWFIGYVCGFGHARFSDYAKRVGFWPYPKPVVPSKDGGATVTRAPATLFRRDCVECNARIQYTLADTNNVFGGGRNIQCPECGYNNMHLGAYAVR